MKCQKTHKLTKEDKVKGDKDSVSKRSKREREREREGRGGGGGAWQWEVECKDDSKKYRLTQSCNSQT